MSVRGVDHISISVADLAASLRFYHALLEVPVLGEGEEESLEIARALRVPKARFRYADLDLGDGRILELLEYIEPRGQSVPRALPDPGIAHVGLSVTDLDGVVERLARDGRAPAFAPVTLSEPSWWAGARVTYVTDPDGAVVELVERPIHR